VWPSCEGLNGWGAPARAGKHCLRRLLRGGPEREVGAAMARETCARARASLVALLAGTCNRSAAQSGARRGRRGRRGLLLVWWRGQGAGAQRGMARVVGPARPGAGFGDAPVGTSHLPDREHALLLRQHGGGSVASGC
jgi:hypothetical protein